ncbi:uncharacterized protein ACJ7VT_005032 [Polymixia lowei]
MEQPPGTLDDLQPQDLSTCSIPTVIDLTRKGEECVLNANSLETLRMVKSPSWYPNSGNSKTGLPFSETASSDTRLQSGDHIQPDNAFSNTTVTLSYVSRSHVFSTHDSLSQHSSLYGVPSISKFSLHPSCESEKGLGESGYALSQHYLEQVDRPLDLATQTELLQALSQAQVGNENDDAAVCVTQQSHELNGGVGSSDVDMDKHVQGGVESGHSRDTESDRGLENGQGNSWSGSGACVQSSPESLAADTGAHQEKGDSEVLFLVSRTQEPVVIQDGTGDGDLCSLSREYVSPLEDPVSPSATSLDDVEDVFILPQASSSPSADNSNLEEASWDGLNTEGPIQPSVPMPSSDCTPRLDTSNECTPLVHRRKAILEPMIDLTDEGDLLSDVSEKKPKTAIPHMNGNARTLQRTFKKKKLPMRSGRGTRLEAIVLNISPNRFKVSRCARSSKKAKTPQATAGVSNLASLKKKDPSFAGKNKARVKSSISVKKAKLKAATPPKQAKTDSINTDNCKESTSDSEIINNSKNSHNSTPQKMHCPQFVVHGKSKKEPEDISHPEYSPESSPRFAVHRKSKKKTEHISQPQPTPVSSPQFAVHEKSSKEPENIPHHNPSPEIVGVRTSPPPPKSPKKSPAKHTGKSTDSKTSPAAKTKAARPPKRRRKKHTGSQSSSIFPPNEPEIKLKYVTYKEEKRDSRLDTFSPFVRVERKPSSPSLCTVINYPEEAKPRQKKGPQQQGHPGGFVSGVVPSTSCVQLGRASTQSQHHGTLVCCLCSGSANAMDLGDLHGPYYPEGYRPSAKTPASTPGLKDEEEDYSDSDSSSCSLRGRGRKCDLPSGPWPRRPGTQLTQKDSHPWNHDSDPSGSPAAKRARTDAGPAAAEDWYSPPVVPLEPCEYWLHEDCCIWSAGVFLVKGKVYGLEEAVKVAQETMCSGCRNPGATLGCFFKGCPNKYHYRCALESDCVLIEENFSMKCKKHKSKTFKAPPGNRWDDR